MIILAADFQYFTKSAVLVPMFVRYIVVLLFITQPIACVQSNGNSTVSNKRVLIEPCADSTYIELLAQIEKKKVEFKLAYLQSPVKIKINTIDSCRGYLQTCMADSLFSYWQGTSWAFYGTTEKPQCGDIACGYFVTTLLRDLGFKIPRMRWAQAASETFIREFCNNKVYHQVNRTQEEVMQFVDNCKGSYYLVGLDNHVGIIEKRNGEINFIHSAEYMDAHGVTREPASSENPFAVSRYRVLVNCLQMCKWSIGFWTNPIIDLILLDFQTIYLPLIFEIPEKA
jgi:hypothetical protein